MFYCFLEKNLKIAPVYILDKVLIFVENEWMYELEMKRQQEKYDHLNNASNLISQENFKDALEEVKIFLEDNDENKNNISATKLLGFCEKNEAKKDQDSIFDDIKKMKADIYKNYS